MDDPAGAAARPRLPTSRRGAPGRGQSQPQGAGRPGRPTRHQPGCWSIATVTTGRHAAVRPYRSTAVDPRGTTSRAPVRQPPRRPLRPRARSGLPSAPPGTPRGRRPVRPPTGSAPSPGPRPTRPPSAEAASRRRGTGRAAPDLAGPGPGRGRGAARPPLPMLSADAGLAPTRDQSKVVLARGAFLIVAIVFGFLGVRRSAPTAASASGAHPPRRTRSRSPPRRSPSHRPRRTTPAASTFAVLGATGFDPEGDGAERNGEAPRVFDGKDATFWSRGLRHPQPRRAQEGCRDSARPRAGPGRVDGQLVCPTPPT